MVLALLSTVLVGTARPANLVGCAPLLETHVPSLIIAEIGVNHNGDTDRAREMVTRARSAGADVVKFQTYRTDSVISRNAPKAAYQNRNTPQELSQRDMVRALELSPEAHQELVTHCQSQGIEFLSTAFDLESLKLLKSLGLARFKIPSGEITNLPLLRALSDCHSPLLLSTGMATLGEIERAIAVIEDRGVSRDSITILQCTTEYPAPASDVNLRAMVNLGRIFGVRYGLSDHTMGWEVAVAAVALGASVIEKHFTLDRSLPGPDHQASLEPKELAEMVRCIRNVEAALGDGIKRVADSEAANLRIARRSIVAARSIAKGDVFTEDNLAVKRPGGGISPMRWDEVLGRVAVRDFKMDDQIELE